MENEYNNTLRKLTDEEKQKVLFVVNTVIHEDVQDKPTEEDILKTPGIYIAFIKRQ